MRSERGKGHLGDSDQPWYKKRPSVSELAERIKGLKAEHSIESAPQRVRQKQSTAKEPVTARIRRRKQAIPDADAATGEAPPTATSQPPESTAQNSSTRPEMTFQERIAGSDNARTRNQNLT